MARRVVGIAVTVVAAAVLTFACSPGPPTEPSTGGAPPFDLVAIPDANLAEPLSSADIALGEMVIPDLAALELGVRQQIEDQRAMVAALRLDPTTPRGRLAEELGALGMLYHVYDMTDAAESCYVNTVTLAPGDYRWAYYLGRLKTDRGQHGEARSHYNRALSAKPGFVPAQFWLADALRNLGETERARTVLTWTVRENPSGAAAVVALGQVDLSLGDYRSAATRFESALELKPGTPSIHYGLAMAYRALGRMDASREHLLLSAPGALYPDDPAMVALMSLAHGRAATHSRAGQAMNAGRFEYAADEFQRLVAQHPDDPWTWVNLGLARVGLGEQDAAIAAFEAAVRIDPDQLQAHMELARIRVRRERFEQAIPHLEEVLRVDPEEIAASFLLGTCLLETAQPAEAVPHLEDAVAGSPGTPGAHIRLAMALCWTDRHSEALGILEEAFAAMPDRPPLTEALARLLACGPDGELRDGERALSLIEQVVGDEIVNLSQAQTTAMAHAAAGEFRSAVRWQQRALEAANSLNRPDLLSTLENNHERYRDGRACETPWPPPAPGR